MLLAPYPPLLHLPSRVSFVAYLARSLSFLFFRSGLSPRVPASALWRFGVGAGQEPGRAIDSLRERDGLPRRQLRCNRLIRRPICLSRGLLRTPSVGRKYKHVPRATQKLRSQSSVIHHTAVFEKKAKLRRVFPILVVCFSPCCAPSLPTRDQPVGGQIHRKSQPIRSPRSAGYRPLAHRRGQVHRCIKKKRAS